MERLLLGLSGAEVTLEVRQGKSDRASERQSEQGLQREKQNVCSHPAWPEKRKHVSRM